MTLKFVNALLPFGTACCERRLGTLIDPVIDGRIGSLRKTQRSEATKSNDVYGQKLVAIPDKGNVA
jgi:hypothetical protein